MAAWTAQTISLRAQSRRSVRSGWRARPDRAPRRRPGFIRGRHRGSGGAGRCRRPGCISSARRKGPAAPLSDHRNSIDEAVAARHLDRGRSTPRPWYFADMSASSLSTASEIPRQVPPSKLMSGCMPRQFASKVTNSGGLHCVACRWSTRCGPLDVEVRATKALSPSRSRRDGRSGR